MPFQDAADGTSSPADTSADTSSPDSTTTPDTSGGSQAAPNPGDNTASSPDAPVDDKAALLAVVQKVVQAEPKNPAGEGSAAAPDGSSTTETKPDVQAAAPAALEEDPTPDELKALAPKTKARIEKLLDQRKAARQEAEALRPAAAKWAQMDGYLKKHDLAPEDANTLLGVGTHLRAGRFKEFLAGVMPYVELAQQALGQAVSPALRARVESGELTEEAAKQLTMANIANSRLQGQVKAQTDAVAAQRVQQQTAQVMQSAASAVTQWEAGIRSRDPDYARKAAEVEEEAKLLIGTLGRPIRSPEEAIQIAEKAYARVNRLFAAGRPAPVSTPKQPSGARAVNGAKAEPKNLMEAAMQGLERARA